MVPVSLLCRTSICYSAGVGEDISFDLAVIERFGCDVFAFDPTPRAVAFARQQAAGVDKFHLHPVGLWCNDARLRFYAPRRSDHVSHSVVNLYGTNTFFEAECKGLWSLMRQLGHHRIDLLKIDIEGAEYAVLQSLIEEDVPVGIICVEFDQPSPLRRMLAQMKALMRAGYELVSIDGWNSTFVEGAARTAKLKQNSSDVVVSASPQRRHGRPRDVH